MSLCQRLQLNKFHPIIRRFSDLKRSTTDLGDGVKAENMDSTIEGHRPMYATKQTFDKKLLERRFQSADLGTGQKPTKWQKRFLVLTKLYKHQDEIPDFVANGTMNRMHDRLRVVFIIAGCLGFFSIFFITESINARRISRDRDRGVVVTKM